MVKPRMEITVTIHGEGGERGIDPCGDKLELMRDSADLPRHDKGEAHGHRHVEAARYGVPQLRAGGFEAILQPGRFIPVWKQA